MVFEKNVSKLQAIKLLLLGAFQSISRHVLIPVNHINHAIVAFDTKMLRNSIVNLSYQQKWH